MTRQELFTKKINHALVSKYDIELITFINGYTQTYFKDLETNRCYQETGTKNLKSQFDNVKRRIKNSIFDEIYKSCQIPE